MRSTLAAFLAVCCVAAPALAQGGATRTVAQWLDGSGDRLDNRRFDFDILRTAVDAANLTGLLDNRASNLTLFAPNDNAFILLARDLGFQGSTEQGAWDFLAARFAAVGAGDPAGPLDRLLRYHIVPRRVAPGLIQRRERGNGSIATLIPGRPLRPRSGALVDFDPDAIDPRRILPGNIQLAGAVVHPINRVLLPDDLSPTLPSDPGTITGVLERSGGDFDTSPDDFDLLFTAVRRVNLTGLGAQTARLTLMAPTDAAFIASARDLGFTGDDEAGAWNFLLGLWTLEGNGDPDVPLADLLLFHILSGRASPADLTRYDAANRQVFTLFDNRTIEIRDGRILDGAPSLADPRITNPTTPTQAVNGNIYTLDRLLFPSEP